MRVLTLANQKFFGLLELDPSGQVLYSRIEKDGRADGSAVDITGRNFFSEVAPFENVEEFQRCLDSFRRSSQQANSISFTCQYEDGPLKVKVLLARIHERSERDRTKAILVHIREAQ
jgi:hypothetical protein